MSLLDRHLGFVGALRAAGVPVSVSEDLDGLRAARVVDWDRRATLRATYAATMLKRPAHREVFDALFDLWFPPRVGAGADPAPTADDGASVADLRERVVEATSPASSGASGASDPSGSSDAGGGGPADLEALAVEAVGRLGRLSGRPDGASAWSAYTTLRRLGDLPDTSRAEEFREAVGREALRRLAEQKGAEHVASTAVRPPTDRLAFTSAGARDLAAIRREIAPLARRLAARLAHDQRVGGRGPLDVRRTVRASLATGGVPLETRHRPRRERRTDLVVLCDVSGSVAHFSRFTLLLVTALKQQFRGVRAFAFVDDVVEITDLLRPDADVAELLAAAAGGAGRSGRTDYGRSLRRFVAAHPEAVGPRSTLLVLGDARSNYADPGLAPLAGLVDAARRAWWLNPEPVRHWDTGDSAASRYAAVVPMAECRDLAQLGRFVRDHL